MKDRSRSVYDLGLLIVIVSAVAFATNNRSFTKPNCNSNSRARSGAEAKSQSESNSNADQLVHRSGTEALRRPQYRTGEHGGTHRRHRRR